MKRKNEVGSGRESPTDEAALERAERLGNLLTLSYEPMLAWRLDGPIEFWNAGAERLYGFAQDEAVGRTSHALLRTKFPIDFADLRSQLRDRRNWMGELRHTCKDGSKVIVESHMQLFSDGLVLEANRDITERIADGSCASRKRATIALAGLHSRVQRRRDRKQKSRRHHYKLEQWC